jgi:hypothetical protein
MRLFCSALVVTCLLIVSVQAVADVTLVKADSVGITDEVAMNQHRYESAIKKMDTDSDQITNQLVNHNRGTDSGNAGGMKVTLIKVRRKG